MVLSFQGPSGGLVFPMQGVSTHWFAQVFQPQSIGDIGGSFERSLWLGLIVMLLTVTLSFLAGLGFRKRFAGSAALFYVAVASLIMPSVVVSLGIGALFEMLGIERNWWSSGLGAHLTWTLPFGLLIMFAVFNRFDKRFEEAARDLGASPVQTVRHVVLPIVLPSLVGVALFGFTLSYDELARSSQALGALNTLPLELQAMQTNATTPVIYALGTLTTALSLVVIGTSLSVLYWLRARQAKKGSDAGKGMGAVAGGHRNQSECTLVAPRPAGQQGLRRRQSHLNIRVAPAAAGSAVRRFVMRLFDLTGRVAIVTGGNGGIGLAMARGLGQAGAAVVVVGRNADKSAAAVAELENGGARAVAIEADVTRGGRLRGPGREDGRAAGAARHPGQQCRDQRPQAARGL